MLSCTLFKTFPASSLVSTARQDVQTCVSAPYTRLCSWSVVTAFKCRSQLAFDLLISGAWLVLLRLPDRPVAAAAAATGAPSPAHAEQGVLDPSGGGEGEEAAKGRRAAAERGARAVGHTLHGHVAYWDSALVL
eukprot:6204723-Pleurochrysis_carterae.AAC.1